MADNLIRVFPRPFRNWIAGLSRAAGSAQADAVQEGITYVGAVAPTDYGTWVLPFLGGNVTRLPASIAGRAGYDQVPATREGADYIVNQRFAAETRPSNVSIPCILYLGRPAEV
jgi:hypothetical protein